MTSLVMNLSFNPFAAYSIVFVLFANAARMFRAMARIARRHAIPVDRWKPRGHDPPMDAVLNLIHQNAMPYWAWCASVALAVYALFLWLERQTGGEGALNAELRSSTVLLLMGAYKVETGEYSRKFAAMFDRLFATASPGRFFLRSALASMLAVAAIAYLLGPVLGLTNTRGASDLSLLQFLALGALINILPDFLSLVETRWLLGRLSRLHHPLMQLGMLILDLILSAAIILGGIHLCHAAGRILFPTVFNTEPPSLIETVALFSPYSIFFYSTFVASVWTWLYFASAWTIRMTSGPLSHVLNIERKPFLSLGTLAAAITFLGLTLAGAALRPTEAAEGGIASRLDIFLCRHFPEDACDHMARLSKDEEDLIRRLEAICEGSSLEYCMGQAWDQFGVNDGHARRLWLRACNAGNAIGCTGLGYLYEKGRGGEKDEVEARRLYRQGCEDGDANGCTNLGVLYKMGLGGEKDEVEARGLHRQACEGGEARGCTNLGTLYERGLGGEKDEVEARRLYRQGCEDGDAMGCNNLGVLYKEGLGGDKDEVEARGLYRQACEGGEAMSCYNLGTLYEQGLGGEKDEVEARRLYRRGCEGGNALGCTNLGDLYRNGIGGEKDEAAARDVFRQGCEGGHAWGCTNLGYLYQNGIGGDQDEVAARDAYQQACDGDDAWGCNNLALLYDDGINGNADPEAAAANRARACALDDSYCE